MCSILSYLEMLARDLITSFLKIGIFTSFKVLVRLFLVTTILGPKLKNHPGRFGVCELDGWCNVELDISGWVVHSNVEHFARHIETLIPNPRGWGIQSSRPRLPSSELYRIAMGYSIGVEKSDWARWGGGSPTMSLPFTNPWVLAWVPRLGFKLQCLFFFTTRYSPPYIWL